MTTRLYKEKLIEGCDLTIESSYNWVYFNITSKREAIGNYPRFHKYKSPREITLSRGDYIFGCCSISVIRGNTIFHPLEWRSFNDMWETTVGTKLHYVESVEVRFLPDWKDTIKRMTKESYPKLKGSWLLYKADNPKP